MSPTEKLIKCPEYGSARRSQSDYHEQSQSPQNTDPAEVAERFNHGRNVPKEPTFKKPPLNHVCIGGKIHLDGVAAPPGGSATNFKMSTKVYSYLTVLVVVCVEVMCLCPAANSTKMHYIHWNTSNPIFRIDNTDHIIDVNKGNIPFEYDQVNIICPVYNKDTSDEEAEKYIIYNVSKEEYDTCRITNPSPRVIAVCDKPYKLMYFTITFRSFTPQPGGLEFRPGQDYYFISTSSKDDLHRRIGGRCSTHHMKVVFKVCCDPSSQPAHDQANNHIPNNGLPAARGTTTTTTTSTTKSTTTTTTPKTTTTSTTTTSLSTTSLKTTSHKSADPHTVKTTKKTG